MVSGQKGFLMNDANFFFSGVRGEFKKVNTHSPLVLRVQDGINGSHPELTGRAKGNLSRDK